MREPGARGMSAEGTSGLVYSCASHAGDQSMTPSSKAASASTTTLIEQAEKWSAHNYHPLPVVLVRGEGVWVYDPDGNRYMDMLSAYSALNQGHRHPRIVQALKDQ